MEKMSLPNSQRLVGKVAVITGGASGIGASTVELFIKHGAKVVIADIQDDRGQAMCNKLGENVSYIHCNVTNEEEVINLIDTAVSKHGKLDIMFNNAGILGDNACIINEATKSDLEKVIGVNLIGGFLGGKHAARVMIPQQSGCIIYTASVSACIVGTVGHHYAASKHAIVGLTKGLAAELGQYRIRVNCVSPSAVKTDIGDGKLVDEATEAFMSENGNLKGEVLKARDVAKAVLYLASDEANYVSGVNLPLDGGFSIVNPSLHMALMGLNNPRD